MSLIKRGCLIAVFSLIISTLSIPAYSETWEKTYGGTGVDVGRSVQQTSDGGYIIVGSTSSIGSGSADVYIIKTDRLGNQLWAKSYGGIRNDGANKVKQTSDGGFIIVGDTESFGNGREHAPDVWVIKIDSNGNKQWDKTFGDTQDDNGFDVEQTPDGGYIIVGRYESATSGEDRMYVIRTQANGNLIWQKTFGNPYSYATCIQKTQEGFYAITGDNNNSRVYFLLIDINGNVEAENTIDIGAGSFEPVFGSSIRQTSDGAFVIAGIKGSVGSLFIFKYLANISTVVWSKNYHGEIDVDANPQLHIDSDENFKITSISMENFIRKTSLINTDSSGNVLWQVLLNDVGDGMDSNITESGASIIVGSSYNTQSFNDVYFIYYSPEPPINAGVPIPANNSLAVCKNPILEWSSDKTALSFDVYLGTNPNLTRNDFKANQTSEKYRLGMLNENTAYYWRIDSKNVFGTRTGEIWSFTTGEKPCTKSMPWLQLLLE